MHSLFSRSHAQVLLRQDGTHLCFHYARKPYLIAFPIAALAAKIAKNTNRSDAIRLTQHVTTNLFTQMYATSAPTGTRSYPRRPRPTRAPSPRPCFNKL
jgi:uncharacterized membrane protein (DUF485 family)